LGGRVQGRLRNSLEDLSESGVCLHLIGGHVPNPGIFRIWPSHGATSEEALISELELEWYRKTNAASERQWDEVYHRSNHVSKLRMSIGHYGTRNEV
jgi:hypothetical protein